MARKRSARVFGPYAHGRRWRVVVVRASGERVTRSFDTRKDAEKVVADALRTLSGSLPVKEACDQYERWLKSTGVRQVTVDTSRQRLDRALGKLGHVPVSALASRAPAIYADLRGRYAVQTHRHTLAELKRWGVWLVEEGFAKASPFAKVKPKGKPNRGKAQLRVNEARELLEACVRELARGDLSALQPLLCLLLGLRASEVSGLLVRDVDDGGRLVWAAQIEHKTEASRRMVEVPLVLQATLDGLTRDEHGEPRPRAEQLIPGSTRFTVLWHAKRLCRLAGVPEVTAHGLRGTHATLATSAGATAELVMTALGHTSTEVARRHYTDQAVAGAALGRKARKRLTGGIE